jgi:hypothetical protein
MKAPVQTLTRRLDLGARWRSSFCNAGSSARWRAPSPPITISVSSASMASSEASLTVGRKVRLAEVCSRPGPGTTWQATS